MYARIFIILMMALACQAYSWEEEILVSGQGYRSDSSYRKMKGSQLLRYARAGDPAAMRILGQRLITGKGMDRNIAYGVRWIEKAIEEDDPIAMYMMGELYEMGRGVPKNEKKAVEWFVKSYEEGYHKAAEKIKKHPIKYALDWWEDMADDGDKDAVLKLMAAYATGDGVSKSISKAKSLYKEAKEKWPKEAQAAIEKLPDSVQLELTRDRSQSDFDILYEAAKKGDEDKIRALVQSGVDIDKRDEDGKTVLMRLAEGGVDTKTESLVVMISAGADVNATDKYGNTPLMRAVRGLQIEKVQVLIEGKADVNRVTTQNVSALEWAIENVLRDMRSRLDENAQPQKEEAQKVTDIVTLLVKAGADVNNVGHQGYTAICRALKAYYFEAAEVLIEAGADVNIAADNGDSPLINVILQPSIDMETRLKWMRKLKEHGDRFEDTVTLNEKGERITESLLELTFKYGIDDKIKETIVELMDTVSDDDMVLVCQHNKPRMLRALLKKGVDVKGKLGSRLLGVAAIHGQKKMMQILRDAGADLSDEEIYNKISDAILLFSVRCSSYSNRIYHDKPVLKPDPELLAKQIKLLLEMGGKLNPKNQEVPILAQALGAELDAALMKMTIHDALSELIKAGADVNATVHLKKLHLGDGSNAIITECCGKDRPVNALVLAAFCADADIVKMMLKRGAQGADAALMVAEKRILKNHQPQVIDVLKKHIEQKPAEDEQNVVNQADEKQRKEYINYAITGSVGIGGLLLLLVLWKVIAVIWQKRKYAETLTTISEGQEPLTPAGPAKTNVAETMPVQAAAPVPQPAMYHVKSSTGEALGEYRAEELKYLISIGAVPQDVIVWTEGMPNWVPFSQVVHE